MKAWITKYALTEGIFKVDGELSENFPTMFRVTGRYGGTYHGKDWHRTKEAAIKRAEQMRAAKLKSIDKQRTRISLLHFNPED